jgi:hypothetical protein
VLESCFAHGPFASDAQQRVLIASASEKNASERFHAALSVRKPPVSCSICKSARECARICPYDFGMRRRRFKIKHAEIKGSNRVICWSVREGNPETGYTINALIDNFFPPIPDKDKLIAA